MFTYKSKQLPKHTKEYTVEVAWDAIVTKREESFSELTTQVNTQGFRKGKAPRDVAARYINPEKLYESTIRKILPVLYKDLVEKEKLKPVTTPSVELVEAKENLPWKLTVTVAETPEVKLKDYKSKISEAHKKAADTEKTKDISEKGKKQITEKSEDPEHKIVKPSKISAPLSEVFTLLLANAECEVPDLLVEEDVNRRLSQLADDIRRVGLTIDQYLASKQTSLEDLKTQYRKDSDEMYKIEFILAKIAEIENLKVEQSELDTILAGAKTDKEIAAAKANVSWYETLLRKQKVLDYLNNL